MPDIFDLNQKDLKDLIKFAKKAPTHFRRAAAGMQNDLAFATMKINKDQIKRSMIVRSAGFVNSSFRVKKARTGSNISTQIAITGSIRRERFSGWVEQELGTPTKRERITTTHARGGSMRKRVQPRARFKRGRTFIKPSNFGGRNYKSQVLAMMRILGSRKRIEQFFLPRRYKRMNPGLYQFRRNKITKLQDTDPSRKQPRRIKWMTRSLNILRRSTDVKSLWVKNINRQLPKKL